jgi:hypothetical protein
MFFVKAGNYNINLQHVRYWREVATEGEGLKVHINMGLSNVSDIVLKGDDAIAFMDQVERVNQLSDLNYLPPF